MHDSHNHLTLVRIRLCQLRRHIAGWGPWYTAATFLTICLATLVVFLQYRSFIPGLVCTSAVLLVVLFVHTRRSDINFVVHTMERPSLNFLAEYFFFTFPFSGPALLTRQWYFFPITVTGLLLISSVRMTATKRTRLPHLSRLVPPEDFEWISGIRKNAGMLALVFALGLALSWTRFLPLVVLWVLTGLVASFYQESEPRSILMAGSRGSASKFLGVKVARHSLLLGTAFLPILVINGWFHPDLIWLNLTFAILQLSALWIAILLKYARYEPGYLLPGNSIPVAVALFATVLPFLLPVSLLMGMRFMKTGTSNLTTYLDA